MYARINIDYHFYHFTQSVCTHVRTGFKAVTPLPQCMSSSHTMMCTHVSILITISIIFTQSVCTHVRTGLKAVTPLSQCMSSSHQNLIIFHGYQYFLSFLLNPCVRTCVQDSKPQLHVVFTSKSKINKDRK